MTAPATIILGQKEYGMTEHSVVGIYDTMTQAEEAVHTLDQAGFPVKHISIVTQSLARNTTSHGYITPGDDLTPRGAAIGAWMGACSACSSARPFSGSPGLGRCWCWDD
jgi:hypothetical protein